MLAKKFGDRKAAGYRDVINTVEEEKEIKKMVDGKETVDKKKWKLSVPPLPPCESLSGSRSRQPRPRRPRPRHRTLPPAALHWLLRFASGHTAGRARLYSSVLLDARGENSDGRHPSSARELLSGRSPAQPSSTPCRPSEIRSASRRLTLLSTHFSNPSFTLSEYKYVSYNEINARIGEVASGLRHLGIAEGARVSIYADTS